MIFSSTLYILLLCCIGLHLGQGRSQFDFLTSVGGATCTQICSPDVYSPICGSDGVTYENDCELENAACTFPSTAFPRLFKVADGPCTVEEEQAATGPCPEECPDVYDPVCGSDGNIYSNECDLNFASCQDSSIFRVGEGDCGLSTASCTEECSQEYQPVCGSDGSTYNNECELNRAACHVPSLFKLAEFECGETAAIPSSSGSEFSAFPESSVPSEFSGSPSLSDPSAAFEVFPDEGTFLDSTEPFPVFGQSCDANCGDEYFPICASNGQTYSNDCYLEVAICRDQLLTRSHYGEC